MKSGMTAAEAIFEALETMAPGHEPVSYPDRLQQSWLWPELTKCETFAPVLVRGLWLWPCPCRDRYLSLARSRAMDAENHHDHKALKKASEAPKISYPKPDNVISFDRNSSVYLSGTKTMRRISRRI